MPVGAAAGPGEKAVIDAAGGEKGFVTGATPDDSPAEGENRFVVAGGLNPDENPSIVVLSCFVPPNVKG